MNWTKSWRGAIKKVLSTTYGIITWSQYGNWTAASLWLLLNRHSSHALSLWLFRCLIKTLNFSSLDPFILEIKFDLNWADIESIWHHFSFFFSVYLLIPSANFCLSSPSGLLSMACLATRRRYYQTWPLAQRSRMHPLPLLYPKITVIPTASCSNFLKFNTFPWPVFRFPVFVGYQSMTHACCERERKRGALLCFCFEFASAASTVHAIFPGSPRSPSTFPFSSLWHKFNVPPWRS